MPRSGRPPKPTALKLLTGNPGKRAINRAEPKPAKAKKGSRRVPAWLSPDGKREWKRVVPELERLGLLTKIDDGALEGMCAAYARALEADRHVKNGGLTVMTDKGFVLQNPAVAISRLSWTQYRQFASEFGLTPGSRTRIRTTDQKPPADPDDEFLFGKKPGTGTNG
jgi:P27 family predicted phage terminase small subunit